MYFLSCFSLHNVFPTTYSLWNLSLLILRYYSMFDIKKINCICCSSVAEMIRILLEVVEIVASSNWQGDNSREAHGADLMQRSSFNKFPRRF